MRDVAAALAELDRLIGRIDEDDPVATEIDAVCTRLRELGATTSPDDRPRVLAGLHRLEAAIHRHQDRIVEALASLRATQRASTSYAPIRPHTVAQRLNVKV